MGWQGRVESRETISRVFLKDPKMLMNQINQALKHIEKNGFYLSLYQKYFHTIPMH